jgi:Uma2 family endonuclease
MATPDTLARSAKLTHEEVPPLEPGDTLTRAEFERRYDAMPHLKKAELIEGVVHLPSPVRLNRHGSAQASLIGWLWVYWAHTPGIQVADNSFIRLDLDNMPQPDATMLIDPVCGGQARISADDYVELGPEWLGEASASSASIDLHAKSRLYQRNKVREYLVWRVLDQEIDWFALRQDRFERLPVSAAGIYQSEVFPGLWLHAQAMIRLEPHKVLEVLQQGLATPEHAAFVTKLQQALQS